MFTTWEGWTSEDWPTPKPREHETPREASLVALITAVIRGYCLESDLAYGLVATQKSIKDLIRVRAAGSSGAHDDVDLLTGWRGRSVGKLVSDVLSGRRSVRIEWENGEPIVTVSSMT